MIWHKINWFHGIFPSNFHIIVCSLEALNNFLVTIHFSFREIRPLERTAITPFLVSLQGIPFSFCVFFFLMLLIRRHMYVVRFLCQNNREPTFVCKCDSDDPLGTNWPFLKLDFPSCITCFLKASDIKHTLFFFLHFHSVEIWKIFFKIFTWNRFSWTKNLHTISQIGSSFKRSRISRKNWVVENF